MSDVWDSEKERRERLLDQFYAGQIGEPTLALSLEIMGYYGRRLADEMALARMEKAERTPKCSTSKR